VRAIRETSGLGDRVASSSRRWRAWRLTGIGAAPMPMPMLIVDSADSCGPNMTIFFAASARRFFLQLVAPDAGGAAFSSPAQADRCATQADGDGAAGGSKESYPRMRRLRNMAYSIMASVLLEVASC